MAVNKNKSEIAESFKNLLQKADEMALEKKKDDLIKQLKLSGSQIVSESELLSKTSSSSKDRLGIKSIKRIPDNPFKIFKKRENEEYLKSRKELTIKLSTILNKHIHYWLQKEMPKFAKIQLNKHISHLLLNIKK